MKFLNLKIFELMLLLAASIFHYLRMKCYTYCTAGSSAPELFTSLAAVTNNSDIGVGTIVG